MALGEGLTSQIIKSGEALRVGTVAEATARGAIMYGDSTESYLGVPIRSGAQILGVLSIARYEANAFTAADEQLVSTIASSMGVALENARLFEETKRLLSETEQRNAELAVINEIGTALAEKLDFKGIIDAVGDRIRAIFGVQSGIIALYDELTNNVALPYLIDQGERYEVPDRPLTGLMATVIGSRKTLRLNTADEATALGAIFVGSEDSGESWLGVPILAGDRVLGGISLERNPQFAFSESDERLLSTVASNLGVALENARLFDETKRLLTETDERAAELAIINSVQEGLAAKLDMQSMYELVVNKIQEIFDAQSVDIGLYDHDDGTVRFPYSIERGAAMADEDSHPMGPMGRLVIETRTALLINDIAQWSRERGVEPLVVGEPTKSAIYAPLMSGDLVFGRISIQNIDRTHAFGEADVRLLTTLASSLSVALENARLFGETQRLLAETNERAAELAIINGVQQGLAAKLDMQSMYDLVGDKIQEIFDAQIVDIGLYNASEGLMHFPYSIERGVRFPDEPMPLGGFAKIVFKTRTSIMVNDIAAWYAERGLEMPAPVQGEPAKSVLFVPLISNKEVIGRISLQNIDRTNAFTEANERLLTTMAGSLSVALENARLFDETQRLLNETNERAAELAIINSVQESLAAKLDMQAMYDLVGDKIREIFDAQVVDDRHCTKQPTMLCT